MLIRRAIPKVGIAFFYAPQNTTILNKTIYNLSVSFMLFINDKLFIGMN